MITSEISKMRKTNTGEDYERNLSMHNFRYYHLEIRITHHTHTHIYIYIYMPEAFYLNFPVVCRIIWVIWEKLLLKGLNSVKYSHDKIFAIVILINTKNVYIYIYIYICFIKQKRQILSCIIYVRCFRVSWFQVGIAYESDAIQSQFFFFGF